MDEVRPVAEQTIGDMARIGLPEFGEHRLRQRLVFVGVLGLGLVAHQGHSLHGLDPSSSPAPNRAGPARDACSALKGSRAKKKIPGGGERLPIRNSHIYPAIRRSTSMPKPLRPHRPW